MYREKRRTLVPKSSLSFSVSCLCVTAYFAVGNGDRALEEAPEGSDEWFVFWSYLTCHRSLLFYVSIC